MKKVGVAFLCLLMLLPPTASFGSCDQVDSRTHWFQMPKLRVLSLGNRLFRANPALKYFSKSDRSQLRKDLFNSEKIDLSRYDVKHPRAKGLLNRLNSGKGPSRHLLYLQTLFSPRFVPQYRSTIGHHWIRRAASLAIQNGQIQSLEYISWLLNPLPFDATLYNRKVRNIYEKVKKDANVELTNTEATLLAQKGLLTDLQGFRDYIRNRSTLEKFATDTAPKWSSKILKVSALLLVLTMLAATDADGLESISSATNTSAAPPRVALITDTKILPHTAILVDGYIYNFGQTSMTKISLADYYQLSERAQSTMQLTFVEIKANDQQIRSLKKLYEENLWKDYRNVTGINDCTRMTLKPLEKVIGLKVPSVVDASPTLTMYWLMGEGMAGNDLIGRTYSVNPSSKTYLTSSIVSSLSHTVEAKLFLLGAPVIYSTQRVVDRGEVVFENDLIEKEISSQRKKAEEKVTSDAYLTLMRSQYKLAERRNKDPELLAEISEQIKEYLNKKILVIEEILHSSVDRTEFILLNAEKEALESVRSNY